MSIRSTRGTLVEQVRRLLSSFNPRHEDEIDDREIGQQVDQVANDLANRGLLEAMAQGDGSMPGQYLYTAPDLPVVRTVVNQVITDVTVLLPVNFLNLPFGRGIYEVWYVATATLKRVRLRSLPAGADLLFSNTMAGNWEKQTGYYLSGQTLVLLRFPAETSISAVTVRFVVPGCSALDDDAPYPVYGDMEDQLIQRVYQFFAGGRSMYKDISINSPEGVTPG